MMMMVVAAMMMITMIALVRHSSGGVERRELLSVRGPLGYTWGFNSFAYKLKCSIVFFFLFCASSQSSCRLYPGRSSLCVAAPNFIFFNFWRMKKQNKKQPLLIHIARILFSFCVLGKAFPHRFGPLCKWRHWTWPSHLIRLSRDYVVR